MPKFITIGYGSEQGYQQTDPNVRAKAHEHDEVLKQLGALLGIAGAPVQVRNADASGILLQEGAFMSAPLPIAGFAVIEAVDREAAVALVSGSPCAVAHGVVEIWPLQE